MIKNKIITILIISLFIIPLSTQSVKAGILDKLKEDVHVCGPAKVESTGKGLHLARNIKLLQIDADLPGFPRYPATTYLIYAKYNDKNASTKITTLKDNKTFYINGSHSIFVCQFSSMFLVNMKMFLRKFNITTPITELQGRMFWYFNVTSDTQIGKLVKYITCMAMIFSWYLIWPFKIKSQLISLFRPVTFYGYTPFVIWKEN